MSKTQLKLTILSPIHNEASIVESFATSALRFLKANKINGELILVENGSTDNTTQIIFNLQKKHPNLVLLKTPDGEGNKGKALELGLENSRGEFIVTLDTDLWDQKFVMDSLENLKNFDVVVGSKSLKNSHDARPVTSKLMNLGYNFIMKFLFDFQGTESHAKLSFRREKIIPLVKECKTEDLVFDTELILRVERAKLSKLEIPTGAAEIRPRRFSVVAQLSKTIRNTLILLNTLGPKFNRTYLLLILALALGIYLRTAHLSDWFFFSVDEEHYSFMTRMITIDHHFPLIGGPISGTKLYMAPWFLYFNALFFLLSNNNPIFSGLVFSLLECLTILLVYLIGKRLFSKNAGLFGAILYSGSFLMALFDRHFWNITLTPLISALTLYCLLRWLEGDRKWLWFTALVVGFGLSTTFSVFAIFLFALIVIARFKKDLAIFILIVLVLHVPLALFDLRHNFQLTRGLLEFMTAGTSSLPLIPKVVTTFQLFVQTLGKALVITSPLDVSNEISICKTPHYFPAVWSIILAIFSLGIYLQTALKTKNNHVWLPALLLLVNLFSLFIFRTDAAERHWLPFLPAFFVIVGLTFAKAYERFKLGTLIVVVILLTLNLYAFLNSYASYGISRKIGAVKTIISQTESGKFSLTAIGDCHMWGYRYFFSWLNHEPADSYLDPSFSWMYSQKPMPEKSEKKVKLYAPNNGALKVEYEKI